MNIAPTKLINVCLEVELKYKDNTKCVTQFKQLLGHFRRSNRTREIMPVGKCSFGDTERDTADDILYPNPC